MQYTLLAKYTRRKSTGRTRMTTIPYDSYDEAYEAMVADFDKTEKGVGFDPSYENGTAMQFNDEYAMVCWTLFVVESKHNFIVFGYNSEAGLDCYLECETEEEAKAEVDRLYECTKWTSHARYGYVKY